MLFKFKQFIVDQSGCAMKINTDGVLLGALATGDDVQSILDIGTGTGVIALMLAQQFKQARIDAVEIDATAAVTAGQNFETSPFDNKPQIYQSSFQQFFDAHLDKRYDLIISNPPFHINSLEASAKQMKLAKHTDELFFEELIASAAKHLTANGTCWLILPLPTAALVKALALQNGLYLQKVISIYSFKYVAAHRQIIILSPSETKMNDEEFVIYKEEKVYTEAYRDKLKDFFTIF